MTKADLAVKAAVAELQRAQLAWPPFNTAHEGYAVMLEEVDELWDIVKLKPSLRNTSDMRAEAIQIAAMALRFAIECCPTSTDT